MISDFQLILWFTKNLLFSLEQIPFSLTLRVWDLYLLEGERVLIGMAYNILRMHRRTINKLGMDEMIEFLQVELEKDFEFDDDTVMEKLREAISELASHRLESPGRPPANELPQKPFGMIVIDDHGKYLPEASIIAHSSGHLMSGSNKLNHEWQQRLL